MTDNIRDKQGATPRANGEQPETRRVSPIGRRTLIALAVLCILSFLGHLALLPQLPDMVPTHWDAAGDVDGWSSRLSTLGLDILPLGLLLLFHMLPGMDPRGRAYERMGSFYTGFVAVFTLFMIGMTWTTELVVFGIMPQDGSPIGIIVGTSLGLGLILLGNYLPKVKPNYTFGCKTPWALDSDQNWRLTHRFGGMAMVVAGIAVAISGLFSKQLGGAAPAILLIAVIGSSASIYLYSYLVFRHGNKPLRVQ